MKTPCTAVFTVGDSGGDYFLAAGSTSLEIACFMLAFKAFWPPGGNVSSPFLGNPSEAEGSTSLAMACDMDALRAFSPPGGRSANCFSRPPQLYKLPLHNRRTSFRQKSRQGKGEGEGEGKVLPVVHVTVSLT